MDIVNIFSTLDSNVLTISFGFFGIYAGIHFSLFENIGDLKKIKTTSIKAIAVELSSSGHEIDGVVFIEHLYSVSKVLVLPAEKKDRHFKTAITSFLLISLLAMFYSPIQNIIPSLPAKGWILFIYSASFGIASAFLWYQIVFFKEFNRLQRSYPFHAVSSDIKIKVYRLN